MTSIVQRSSWLKFLASPRWTVAFFLLTALASLAIAHEMMAATALMALPFVLLVANLLAALLTHPRIRIDPALLLLHLALLALVALLVLARLVYLDGRATLTRGTAFDGQLQQLEQGPLHPGQVESLHFINDGFSEDFYRLGKGRFKSTYNNVRWQDSAGRWHAAQIGDDQPLLLNGYRIYTTRRRGFSPLFQWQPHDGAGRSFGTVQLSAETDENYVPATAWQLPAGPEIWVMLDTALSVAASQAVPSSQAISSMPSVRGQRSNLGAAGLEHRLVLRIGEQRFELKRGQSLALTEGTLTYLRLDTWMGYLISYDPTMPWIMAVILIGTASLTWFYWRRVFQ